MAVAVAATGVVGRRKDNELLAKWTQEQAIPTVALVSPQARRGNARARASGKCRSLLYRSDPRSGQRLCEGMAEGHRRQGPAGRRARRDRHAGARPEHLGRRERTQQSQGQPRACERDRAAMELVARVGGGVATDGRRKDRRRPGARRRGRRRPGRSRPPEGAEGVREDRRPVRRRRHRAQHRRRIVGQGGRASGNGVVRRLRRASDADLRTGPGDLRRRR